MLYMGDGDPIGGGVRAFAIFLQYVFETDI